MFGVVAVVGWRCAGVIRGGAPAGAVVANATLADVKEYYRPGAVSPVTAPLIVAATVVAAADGGNFHGRLVLEDATGGITAMVATDAEALAAFGVGDAVVLRAEGLAVGGASGSVVIGVTPTDGRGGLDPLPRGSGALARYGDASARPAIATRVPAQALRPSHYGRLVEVCGVQVARADTGGTFAHVRARRARNVTLVDCAGNRLVLRTGGRASFAEAPLPTGSGCVTGVASTYRGQPQLRARTRDDISLSGTRCTPPPTEAELRLARVAAARVPRAEVVEAFEGQVARAPFRRDGWTDGGTDAWTSRSFEGNGYVQVSAYGSSAGEVDAWLISPAVEGTPAKTLSFRTATAYYKHDGLTVLVSRDHVAGADPRVATWTPLDARIADSTSGDNQWVDSGPVRLPAVPDVRYVAFRYRGSGPAGRTSTFRLDDVLIKTN